MAKLVIFTNKGLESALNFIHREAVDNLGGSILEKIPGWHNHTIH